MKYALLFLGVFFCSGIVCMDMDVVRILDTKAKIAILKKDEQKFDAFKTSAWGAPHDLLKERVGNKLTNIRKSLTNEGNGYFASVKKALAMDDLFWCRVEKIAECLCGSQKNNFHVPIPGIITDTMDPTTFCCCCNALKNHEINVTRFDFYDHKGKNQLIIKFPFIPYSAKNKDGRVRIYAARAKRGAIVIDSSTVDFSAIRQELLSCLVERLKECCIDDCRLSVIFSLKESIGDTFQSSSSTWEAYNKFLFKQALISIALKNHEKAKMVSKLAFKATSYVGCDEAQLILFSKIARYWKMCGWIEEQPRSKIAPLVPRADRHEMFVQFNAAVQSRYFEALKVIKKEYSISESLWQSIMNGIRDLRRYNADSRMGELPSKDAYVIAEDPKARTALFLLERNIDPRKFFIHVINGDNYIVEAPFVGGGYAYFNYNQTLRLNIIDDNCLPGIISIPKNVHNAMLEHIACMIECDLDQADRLLTDVEKYFNQSNHSLLISDAWKHMIIAKRLALIVFAATKNEEAAIFLKKVAENDFSFSADDRALLLRIVTMWRLKGVA